jgi:hypothetical protein
MDNLNEMVSDETIIQETIPTEDNFVYNPVVEDDIENVELDTSEIGVFKIDESMPDELKEQLKKFNEKTESLNSIISGISSDTSESINDEDTNDDEDGTFDDDIQDESIQEDDNFDVGDIF